MDENEDKNSEFSNNLGRDGLDSSAFELSGDFWKNKYESDRFFWDERIKNAHAEKEAYKNEADSLKNALDNLNSRVKELEQNFNDNKMLYEQKLEMKIKELDAVSQKVKLENRISGLEKRNVILRKGLIPQDVVEDTELRSPSAVLAMASQKIMLDMALEKEALGRKIEELNKELERKQKEIEEIHWKADEENCRLEKIIQEKESLINQKRGEALKKLDAVLMESSQNMEIIKKEYEELSCGFSSRIKDVLHLVIISAKDFLSRTKMKNHVRQGFDELVAGCQQAADSASFFQETMEMGTPVLKGENVESVVDEYLKERLGDMVSENLSVQKKYIGNLPEVLIDKSRIIKVIKVVVDNAVEAMPQGGNLFIETDIDFETGNVIVIFTDHGPGLPRENVNMLFKPYFTTKPAHQGLGLYYACKVMKLHGGSILLESEHGTSAKLYFKYS